MSFSNIRYYPIKGKQFISVTSVLKVIAKPELVNWAAREAVRAKDAGAADKIANAAATRGTRVHEWIEATLKGRQPPDLTDKEAGYAKAFELCKSRHKMVPLTSEEVVHHEQEGIAGTLDATYEVDGVPTLMDYKTVSNGRWLFEYPPYREHRLQLEAYRRCKLAMTATWLPQVAVLRLGPQGQYALSMWRQHTPDINGEADMAWAAFKQAKGLLEFLLTTQDSFGDEWATGSTEGEEWQKTS